MITVVVDNDSGTRHAETCVITRTNEMRNVVVMVFKNHLTSFHAPPAHYCRTSRACNHPDARTTGIYFIRREDSSSELMCNTFDTCARARSTRNPGEKINQLLNVMLFARLFVQTRTHMRTFLRLIIPDWSTNRRAVRVNENEREK